MCFHSPTTHSQADRLSGWISDQQMNRYRSVCEKTGLSEFGIISGWTDSQTSAWDIKNETLCCLSNQNIWDVFKLRFWFKKRPQTSENTKFQSQIFSICLRKFEMLWETKVTTWTISRTSHTHCTGPPFVPWTLFSRSQGFHQPSFESCLCF